MPKHQLNLDNHFLLFIHSLERRLEAPCPESLGRNNSRNQEKPFYFVFFTFPTSTYDVPLFSKESCGFYLLAGPSLVHHGGRWRDMTQVCILSEPPPFFFFALSYSVTTTRLLPSLFFRTPFFLSFCFPLRRLFLSSLIFWHIPRGHLFYQVNLFFFFFVFPS